MRPGRDQNRARGRGGSEAVTRSPRGPGRAGADRRVSRVREGRRGADASTGSRPRRAAEGREPGRCFVQEWLVTNGLGGYAAGTVGGLATRRYHGLLTAALPAPFGRQMRLNHVAESLRLPDGTAVAFGDVVEIQHHDQLRHLRHLQEFRLDHGLPVWRYEIEGHGLEKRVVMPHRQNTVQVSYRLLDGGPVRLALRPAVHFRSNNAPVGALDATAYTLTVSDGRYELADRSGAFPLRLCLHHGRTALVPDERTLADVFYPVEEHRGYEASGELWSPGFFEIELAVDREVVVVASTEAWETLLAPAPAEVRRIERRRREELLEAADSRAQHGTAARLVLAADQFVIDPVCRVTDAARAGAAGEQVRSIIAGYHWFTDWGRDTMISLEGLTLVTGRHAEARYILGGFADHVRDGLIPNLFPEGEEQGLYHTADATLWYFHAIDRYLEATGDRPTLRRLLPSLRGIVEHHLRGTRFGIGADPRDGLLRQGQEGYQLTWMDAKVGDWVVTPRRGKAVEVNALWYNALRLLANWLREEDGDGDQDAARALTAHADRARRAFNERFWYAAGGHLYDVVDGEDGDDPSCRPNQVLAIALRHPVLEPRRWPAVLQVVTDRLLTPKGLRSLAPTHPDYQPRYDGDRRSRDAAYHQGTVWPWLIGPFIDAWLRVHPDDRAGARGFLHGILDNLDASCLGTISEIFDAEAPYAPGGCAAQAWSVAEALQGWVRTAE